MAKQPSAEFDVNSIGRVREDIGPQSAEHRLEYRDREKRGNQNIQGAHAPMHKDLVNDDLKDQGRRQRKHLQEKRRRKHFAEQTAVLDDRAEEPQ